MWNILKEKINDFLQLGLGCSNHDNAMQLSAHLTDIS